MKLKICKSCWKQFKQKYSTLEKYCSPKCVLDSWTYKQPKTNTKPLKRTNLKKIWKLKTERLKRNWAETKVFKDIWAERPHICDICLQPIRKMKTFCFPHKLPKWKYPEYRYNKRNIWLVCSIECHQEFDRKNAKKDLELINYINGT